MTTLTMYLKPNSPHIRTGFEQEMEAAARGDNGDKGWRPLRISELMPPDVKIIPGAQLEAEELANEIAEDLRMEAQHG